MASKSVERGVMSEVFYLGVDGGGTGCRARLEDNRGGRVLGAGVSGPATTRLGANHALLSVMAAAEAAFEQAGLSKQAFKTTHAVIGLAGIGRKGVRTYFDAWPSPFKSVRFESDAYTACLGAHGGADGGIVITGTGSIGFALMGGKTYRFGGYGFPISDEASGADLGLNAIRFALRAFDGRVTKTPLLAEILERFSNDPFTAVDWMDTASATDYASFAPLVVEHAKREDLIAVQLMQETAAQIEAFIRVLHDIKVPRLSLSGGLSLPIAPWLLTELRALLSPPLKDAVSGAIMLARLSAEKPAPKKA
jgi:glucosamine kinase